MIVMTPQIEYDPYSDKWNYPCLVSPLYPEEVKKLYVPGSTPENPKFASLSHVSSHVIEGYEIDGRFIAFDCMPLEDWQRKSCKLTYLERIALIRILLNTQVCDFSQVIDIRAEEVYNPLDLLTFYNIFLTNGYDGLRIMDVEGLYAFGEAADSQYVELRRL